MAGSQMAPGALARLFEGLPLSARARFFEALATAGGQPPDGSAITEEWHALGRHLSSYDGTGGLVRALIEALHAGLNAEPLPAAVVLANDERNWRGMQIGSMSDAVLLEAIDEARHLTEGPVDSYAVLCREARRRNLRQD